MSKQHGIITGLILSKTKCYLKITFQGFSNENTTCCIKF